MEIRETTMSKSMDITHAEWIGWVDVDYPLCGCVLFNGEFSKNVIAQMTFWVRLPSKHCDNNHLHNMTTYKFTPDYRNYPLEQTKFDNLPLAVREILSTVMNDA